MKARWLLPLLLIAIMAWLPGPLHAQANLQETALRVGYYENNPLTFTGDDGAPQGLFIDILETIATAENWTLAYTSCAFNECLRLLENGDLDLVPAVGVSDTRDTVLDFTEESVVTNWGQIYTLDHDFQSILDLDERSVAVLSGDIHNTAIRTLADEFNISPQFIEHATYDGVFQAVAAGEADYGLVNWLYGASNQTRYGLVSSSFILNPLTISYAAPQGSRPDVLQTIDRHLRLYKSDPTSIYYHAMEQWLTPRHSIPPPQWLLAGLGIGAGVVLLLTTASVVLRRQVNTRTRTLEEEISQHKATQRELQRRQNALEMLLKNSNDISSVLDLTDLLNLIAQRAIDLLSADESVIFELDEAEQVLTPILYLGNHSEATMQVRLPVGTGITGHCVELNKPLLENHVNIATHPYAVQAPGTPVVSEEHIMAAPLSFRGRVTGAMLVSREEKPPFTEDELHLFVGFAQQASVALENARLYRQQEAHNEALENAVAERTAELIAASRVKDEFIGSISHELRTPITNLKLRFYLLNAKPEAAAQHLDVAKRETERLESIIEDLLTISRLDRGRIQAQPRPLDLNALAQRYLDDRASLAEAHNLTLHFQPAADLPTIQADRDLLGQAISILLTNALNYTPEGGSVTITTDHDGENGVTFTITDTGPGIDPDDLPHIFERFYRGAAGAASGAPGTGLGLSIAQEIIEQHHGTITAANAESGTGARFTVWLPVGEESG